MASGASPSSYEKASSVEEGLRILKDGAGAVRFTKITDEGVLQIALLMRINKTCRALNLSNNNITERGTKELALVLKSNGTLEVLNLRFNQVGDGGASFLGQTLKANNSLTSLDLWENEITSEGMKSLAIGLKDNKCLQKINLVENNIGDEGAEYLGHLLQFNSALETIYLNSNNIGDQGAIALAKGLAKNESLKNLFLKGNKIGEEGAKAFVPYLKLNSGLYTLQLERNSDSITGETFQAIAALVKSHSQPMFTFLESKIEFTEKAWEFGATAAAQHKRIVIAAIESLLEGQHDPDRISMAFNSVNSSGQTMVEVALKGQCTHPIVAELVRVLVDNGCDVTQTTSDGKTKLSDVLKESEVISNSSWYKSSSGYKLESRHPLHASSSTQVLAAYGLLSTAKVALKVMVDADAFAREISVRNTLRKVGGSDYEKYITEADSSPATSTRKYLIMARALGSLKTFVLERNMESKKYKSVLRTMAEGLRFMNKNKMVHGNASMENLVCFDSESNLEWKLIDFVSSIEHGSTISGGEIRANSPPEVARAILSGTGLPQASEKLDVWGFGVVLYEMFSGRKLITADSLVGQIDTKSSYEIANWPGFGSNKLKHVGNDLTKALIRSCLHPESSERPSFNKILEHDFFVSEGSISELEVEATHVYVSCSTAGEAISKDIQYIGLSLFQGLQTNLGTTSFTGSIREQVSASRAFICCLPEDAFKRGTCVVELVHAIDLDKPVAFVVGDVTGVEVFEDVQEDLLRELAQNLSLDSLAGSLAAFGTAALAEDSPVEQMAKFIDGLKPKVAELIADSKKVVSYRHRRHESEAYVRHLLSISGLLVENEITKLKGKIHRELKVIAVFPPDAVDAAAKLREGISGLGGFKVDSQWVEVSIEDDIDPDEYESRLNVMVVIGSNDLFEQKSDVITELSAKMKRVISVVLDETVDTVANNFLCYRGTENGAEEVRNKWSNYGLIGTP